MERAKAAAAIVAGWSKAKQAYANRILNIDSIKEVEHEEQRNMVDGFNATKH